ncbi:hypothetical protein Mpet_0858 [Methanolacinia petrolearia DSM 11571]|uniref:Uncharacterized protein n=1 Tax=Methanolacinia petrolearia (strain DSM 11571 / OCM 486 / SEBR 4847) TaxID=679926 RepID=E1RJB1_METP4|nr:hypothetical protein [Methanolacinia petrolearia]ADN35629.1 hypothetical protein Mpet_0858 [Methanolacinia petrolearia DSM 11571]
MKKKQMSFPIFVLVICLILVVLVSGCTYNNPNQHESIPVAQTESVTTETTPNVQYESTQSTVSWKNFYSDHTDQEKSQLIEEAKEEILRVFPNVDESTLDGYWKDHDITYYSELTGTGYPKIVFDNVDDTSDEFMEAQKIRSEGLEQNIQDNIVTIKVDPESGDIVFYIGGMPSPLEEETRKVSLEGAENKAVEFVKNVKGDDFYEEKEDDFYIYDIDTDPNTGSGLAIIVLFNTYKGVQYLNDQIYVRYDRVLDTVNTYSDELKNPELMKRLTTLSPVPDISEDEAKEILETKLKENYPDEDLDIQYTVQNVHENSLSWYDDITLFYTDQPEPIRLIWYITFSDANMRAKDSRLDTPAIIDAHTGEIVSLNFRDIRIS